MKTIKYQLLGSFLALLMFNSHSAMASANGVVDKNAARVASIETIIRQNIALGRLKNTFFHPVITNKTSRPTRNPFADMPKKTVDALARQGINISALSRYKAIYFKGEYLGSQSRKIVNTAPDTVLVIGKGTRLHDPIYSRGPVVSFAQPDDIAGIVASNIVWFNSQNKAALHPYAPFIGMPIVNARDNPKILIASAGDLNKIKRERQNQCKHYTNTSVAQNASNIKLGCGFTGLRWSNNWKGQFDWCMTVLDPISGGENEFRKTQLANCKAKKASTSNPKNSPAIPAACHDPSKQYAAVKQVNHSFRYERKLKSPVKNGLIRYDYNKDRKPDYVFLETKGETARFAICLSRGNSYQRRVTDVSFTTAKTGSYFTDEYWMSQSGDLLKLDIENFEHNGGSSGRYISYRFNTATGKFKIIENKADSAGVEMDGFEFPMAIPPSYSLF